MPQFMNPSNVYWAPEQNNVQTLKPFDYQGFLFNLPYQDPVSTPMGYSGDGSENIYGKRELVFTTQPEYFAVGGIVPTTAGIPRMDINSAAAKHSREHFTVRV